MADRSITILQINTRAIAGGAETIARTLFDAYRARGLGSWLAIGHQQNDDENIQLINHHQYRSRWRKFWQALGGKLSPYLHHRGIWQLQTLLFGFGSPCWWWNTQRGYEDFDFPGVWHLLDSFPQHPDILHCHNLHGDYFDLEALFFLNQQLPTVVTLHDMWLFTGHCAYSLNCNRWTTGCGDCPYLSIYLPVVRDGSAFNRQRKKEILARCKLYVATPSDWMMQLVKKSMVFPGMVQGRVIPNGIDQTVFHPAQKQVVREKLGLPLDSEILLFVASSLRQTFWKDFETMRAAVAQIGDRFDNVIFLALGEDSPKKQIDQATIQFVPYQSDPRVVAQYYQAADLYLHAAYVDNFPTVILESLACGTPVIATAVGGIPEQIRPLKVPHLDFGTDSSDEATGVLIPPGDAVQMASAIEYLLHNEPIRQQLGQNAAADAKQRFSLERMADDYLNYYREIEEYWRMNNYVD